MSGCDNCGAKAVEASRAPAYVRTLWIVVILNAAMFLVGIVVTATSRSVSVQADLLDFLGDAVATGIGLLMVGRTARVRGVVSYGQGVALAALGIFALVSAIIRIFGGIVPEPLDMSVYGLLGLSVNVGCALLLLKHRNGDASVRAVWLYSRNDAIGNVAVILAAAFVVATGTRWPDVAVGIAIAGLFLHSAWEIIGDARRDLRNAKPATP